jgi:hypothetical protein
MALAVNGPVCSVDLVPYFGPEMARPRRRHDPSGLIARWAQGRRVAVGLNSAFRLIAPLQELLEALGESYAVWSPDAIERSRVDPTNSVSPRGYDLDLLFSSRVRTLSLLALELLGPELELRKLKCCVPGEFYKSVRNVVDHYVRENILERRGDTIRFADHSWTSKLRNLLREYAKLRQDVAEEIASAGRRYKKRRTKRTKFGLMGNPLVTDLLVLLAENGPIGYTRALAMVKTESPYGLQTLADMGLVVDHREGRARTLSLNRAHPVYRELRRLLLSIAGKHSDTYTHDYSTPGSFEVASLFGERLRTSVLLALDAAHGGLDHSTLHRILPEHDRGSIRQCLASFAELGVVGSRRWKGMRVYDFDRTFAHYSELRGLLGPINNRWPEYAAAGVEVYPLLEPPGRVRRRKMRRTEIVNNKPTRNKVG